MNLIPPFFHWLLLAVQIGMGLLLVRGAWLLLAAWWMGRKARRHAARLARVRRDLMASNLRRI